MSIKGKQIQDATITQTQLGVTTESIVNATDVTTKKFVDDNVNTAVAEGLDYSDSDYNIIANVTAGVSTSGATYALATNQTITDVPIGGVRVYVNGIEVGTGVGQMAFFAPENSGTPTPRQFGTEQQGDYLWWDATTAKYQLDTGDDVDYVYRTYATLT